MSWTRWLAVTMAVSMLVPAPAFAQQCPEIDNYVPCDGIDAQQLSGLLAGSGTSIEGVVATFSDGYRLTIDPEEDICQVRKCDDKPNPNLWIVQLTAFDGDKVRSRSIMRWRFESEAELDGMIAMMDGASSRNHWYRLERHGLLLATEP